MSSEVAHRIVRGIVVDRTGVPVADALVHLNLTSMRTLADGSFSLTMPDPRLYHGAPNVIVDQLHVLARNGQFAIVPNALDDSGKALHVVLDDAMTFIWGTVVDADGSPVPGAFVSIETGEFFGWIEGSENSGWMATRWEDVWMDGWFHFPTNEHGKFSYPALPGRVYDLHALSSNPLRHTVIRGVAAGTTGLVLRLPGPESQHALVSGVVLTRDGIPASGVTVSPRVQVVLRPTQSTAVTQSEARGVDVRTNASGRFELHDVPRDSLFVAVYGDGFRPKFQRIEPVPTVIEFVLDRLCALRIRVRKDRSPPCAIRADGGAIFHLRDSFGRGRGNTSHLWPASDDIPDTVWLAESVAALLIEDADDETVRRVPIQLDPKRTIDVEV